MKIILKVLNRVLRATRFVKKYGNEVNYEYHMKWNDKHFYLKTNHYLVQNLLIIACHIKSYNYLLSFQQLYHGNNKLEEM